MSPDINLESIFIRSPPQSIGTKDHIRVFTSIISWDGQSFLFGTIQGASSFPYVNFYSVPGRWNQLPSLRESGISSLSHLENNRQVQIMRGCRKASPGLSVIEAFMVPGGQLKVFADYWSITLDDMVSTGRYISSIHTCLYYDRFGKHETNGVVARIVRMIIDTDGVLIVGNM